MYNLLAVVAGGAVGALIRYAVISLAGTAVSWTVVGINLSGSFLIGVWYACTQYGDFAPEWRTLVQAGLLGSFTTFSTLSLELFKYIESARFALALGYLTVSIVGGVAMVYAGRLSVIWARAAIGYLT